MQLIISYKFSVIPLGLQNHARCFTIIYSNKFFVNSYSLRKKILITLFLPKNPLFCLSPKRAAA